MDFFELKLKHREDKEEIPKEIEVVLRQPPLRRIKLTDTSIVDLKLNKRKKFYPLAMASGHSLERKRPSVI